MQVELFIFQTTPNQPFTYRDLDLFQKQYAEKILKNEKTQALVLSEVEPVLTLGRRTEDAHFKESFEMISAQGIDIYPVERGGFVTYHGPGQWVLFILSRLEALVGDSRGVKKVVCLYLKTMAAFLLERYQFETELREGADLGLWSKQSQKKCASIGIQVFQGVLQHGVSINIYPTAKSFFGIRPCGLNTEMAYLVEELGLPEKEWPVFFDQFGAECLRYFESFFNKN